MNEIQEQFEKRTGLSHQKPECKRDLTIFRKGFEAGRAFAIACDCQLLGNPCNKHNIGHDCYLENEFRCGGKPCTIDFAATSK